MSYNSRFQLIIVFVLLLGGLAPAATHSSGNLFRNPSFEETQEPNQFGQVFKEWQGWVYDKPARLAMGTIARTGKHSYELIADQGGKVRLQSQKMRLEPGRYRVQAYIRGLGIGPGQWKRPLDFSVGFDGKFPILNKTGTFGWTPVTYVFQLKHPIDNFQLLIGLLGGGWLWIDDASLEKVGENVALTAEPVIGREEQPVSPPQTLAADASHCPECGYRNNREWENCYGCGHSTIGARREDLPAVRVIADFRDGKPGVVSGGKIVRANHDFAMAASTLVSINKAQDWTGYDYFCFDTFNPSDEPAYVYVEIRDALTKGYWSRVNYDTVVPPGKSTVTIPTDMYVGEKSRPGRPLIRERITHLFINPKGKRLLFDNLRLERLNVDSMIFDGLRAFDFGRLDSPVMEGFRQATIAMIYEPARGFGWDKADLWRSFNALQPDPLYQDFSCPRSGVFRVDLPNGRYHVIMNIDSPGGYWGEVQAFAHRKVLANGSPVVDEKMDMEGFKKRYFRNAVREDLPGIDPFREYVQPMFGVKEFDVTVSDGKLELKFQGEGFAICLSSLVIYPAGKAEQGRKFWEWATERRRVQFNDYFRQVLPKQTGTAAPSTGYALFSRAFMKPVNAFDGPLAGEGIPPQGLSVTVAQGEEAPLTFSVQPAGDMGEIGLEITDLAYSGEKKGAVRPLPAAAMNPGWLDYRIKRVTMEGSVYTVAPRYWHHVPAPAAPGVTRTFWLRVKPPAGIEAGPYKGTITIRPGKGGARTIPVTVKVLPFALDPITDIAAGPWGSDIALPWLGKDPGTAQWQWQMFEKSLDLLKEAGCTSFSGVPHLKVKGAKGRITLDTTVADKEMALIRAKGFSQMVSSYGVDLVGYRMYGNGSGPDVSAAKEAGFADADTFLRAVYAAIDEHAIANRWLPVAWNICDEPLGDAVRGAAANALAHRRAADGLERTTFMGETSMEGNDPNDPHYALVKQLPVPSLNKHDEASLEAVRAVGNRLSFYNDGSRWTYGRYMKMLALKHNLALRLSWHFNISAGDPYYALDCREDDYCWYNTDARQTMVPSVTFLGEIMPGLNDYRYLTTLLRLLKEKPQHPAAASCRKTFDAMVALTPGKDRRGPVDVSAYDADRRALAGAIEVLLGDGSPKNAAGGGP